MRRHFSKRRPKNCGVRFADAARNSGMAPVPIEQLPADTRELINAYLMARPQSSAARLRPRFGIDDDQWVVLYGSDRHSGILGFGPTVLSALASWESNFKEAVTAEQ